MNTFSTPDHHHWQSLHTELQDLLAGYHDNELTEHQNDLIEAHLAGCNDCRDELARQQVLSSHLERLPIEPISTATRQNIEQAILNADDFSSISDKQITARAKVSISLKQIWRSIFSKHFFAKQRLFANSGWAVAALLFIVVLMPPLNISSESNVEIPMINDALTQYQQLQHQNLPVSASSSRTSLPVIWDNAMLLTRWSTIIGGAPAQAFAVRHNNQLVVQYKIDQTVFFRNAKVRQAIAIQGMFRIQTPDAEVMLLPTKDAGLIIVGPKNSLPSRDNIKVRSA